MEPLGIIMSTQLSEKEYIVYMLVESGMTLRDTAKRLGVSYQNIADLHKSAKAKIEKFGELGLFTTPIEKKL